MKNNESGRGLSPNDLTSEKNFWGVARQTFKIPKSVFNITLTFAFFLLMIFYAIFTEGTVLELKQILLAWADRGFSFATGILGFLIAGLAIFTAVNDIKLFTDMSRVLHRESGLSFLKYNVLSLFYVFIVYLVFSILCFIVIIFVQDGGIGSLILSWISKVISSLNINEIKLLAVKLALVFILTIFFYCLMLLKTFIFDIYHLIMTNIRWNLQEENERKRN